MKSLPAPLSTPATDPTAEREALLRTARRLRALALAGGAPPLLQGKHLALVSDGAPSAAQDRVEAAARGLGARVARLPLQGVAGDGPQAREAARLLGRLYDALACEGLPAPALAQLQQACGVPVYEGLGRADHPVAGLLPALLAPAETAGAGNGDGGGSSAGDEDHGFLLQALLVRTLL